MKVTLAHGKTKQEVKQKIDEAIEQIIRPDMPGGVKVNGLQKNWAGDSMKFSLHASVGPFSSPIAGLVEVDDRNVTIECDLPPLVGKFLGESTVKEQVERRIKGLLA